MTSTTRCRRPAADIANPELVQPDANLIAVCTDAARCEERLRCIEQYGTSEKDCDQACDAWNAAFAAVAITPATTLAGVAAKAAALRLAVLRETISTGEVNSVEAAAKIDADGHRDGWLARSLCDDILAMGSAAA